LYEHDLLRSQQALGDHEGADLVVGDHAARVAHDVRVAFLQPEHYERAETGVHAGDHGHVLGRRYGQIALVEGAGVFFVVAQQFVDDAHPCLLS